MSEDSENFDEECARCSAGDGGVHGGPEVAELQAKLETQTDLYLRALADLDNFKKRMQKDRTEARLLATGAIIEEILPVLDNFELGLQSAENHKAAGILEGFRMVFDQLKGVLTSHGLGEFSPLNQEFNPHEHDCVRREYSETLPENTVSCVIRKGYRLHGRLIRPALVAIATEQRSEK